MGTRIIISYVVTLFLAIAGRCGDNDICADHLDLYGGYDSICLVSLPEDSDNHFFSSSSLNSVGAGTGAVGSVKFAKYIYSRHLCLGDKELTVSRRNTTHQISDLMGTIQSLIVLEKLLI